MNYPQVSGDSHTWVQTERATHEAWGRLTVASPRAAALMHHLCAQMDRSAAVVASHAALAALTGMSASTIKRAINDLRGGNWIEVVQLGGKGGALAFIVNSRVGWAASRGKLHMAAFTARVLAVDSEQEKGHLEAPSLRKLPILGFGDHQLPSGEGEDPPSQPTIPGMEIDLPSIKTGENPNPFAWMTPEHIERERGRIFQIGMTELERRGQQRLPEVDKDLLQEG